MKVHELIEKLQAVPDKSLDVVFDTEAAQFMQHLVEIDDCVFDPEWEANVGSKPTVTLYSKAPRQYPRIA